MPKRRPEPAPDPDPDPGVLARASDKLKKTAAQATDKLVDTASQATGALTTSIKSTAQQTLTAENAKSAVATKLVALGFTAIALSGGVDYFSHDDDVHHAIAVAARDEGQVRLGDLIDWLDAVANAWKLRALEILPDPIAHHLAAAAFLAGAILFAAGLRMKVVASPGRRGTILREVGGIIAGPGIAMLLVFVYMSWHATAVVRVAFGSFFSHLWNGETSAGGLGELATHYAPWAWVDVGGVLLVGLATGALAIVSVPAFRKLAPRFAPRESLTLDCVRRTAYAISGLCLGYYLAATLVAIGSYGGALRVIAWPWKLDPGAFLASLSILALGLGLFWAGTIEHRREEELAAKYRRS